MAVDREGSHYGTSELCSVNILNFIVIDEILPLLWHSEQVTQSQLEHGSLLALGSQCLEPHPDVDVSDVQAAIHSFMDGSW